MADTTRAAPRPDLSMPVRRTLFFGLIALATAVLLTLAWRTFAPGGWSVWEVLLFVCLALNAPWLGLAAATGVAGLAVRFGTADPSAYVLPALRGLDPAAPLRLRTAIAVCVRNEDMRAVLPPLDAMLRGLEAAGVGDRFGLAILSDTPEGPAARAEDAAVAALAARHPPGRVFHRRRAENTGYKAGNVMDFCDRHAAGFDAMLLLDADSHMAVPTVLRLVRILQADDRLALIQPTIYGDAAAERSPFPRIFGFGHRHGSRMWATGQAWWQGPDGPFWGHNALLRIAPFRDHCKLGLLPDGAHILSHDHVEAARLHGAGWHVRTLPEDEGSLDAHPPSLPAYLSRDLRWAAGNWQYRYLLRRPELGALGRFQLLQAILHYALTPAFFALLPLAAINVATGGAEGTPRGPLLALLGFAFLCLHATKLSGFLEVLLRPRALGLADSRLALAARALREIAFTQALDPIVAFGKTRTMARLAMGHRSGWPAQQRDAQALPWRDAWRLFWPHTVLGLGLLAAAATGGGFAFLLMVPFAAGLVIAAPLAVMTAQPDPPPGRVVGGFTAAEGVAR